MTFRVSVFAAAAVLCLAMPVAAHHSHGNYRITEYTNLTGTVTDLYWVNPHTWIYLEVAEEGAEPSIWAVEAAGSGTLARRGIAQDLVKVGDTVSVRCHQLRDGSNGCLLGFLTPEGGIEQEWD